jgi:hypothetical protein
MRRILVTTAAVAGLLAALVPGVTAAPARPAAPTGTFVALSYNVAGLPQAISDENPERNSSLISPLLNDYDLVLLQESWGDVARENLPPAIAELLPRFAYHDEVVADADHPYRSEPAPHPYGTDLRRAPSGPTILSDGLNRLSRFPFGELTRVMWRSCHGDLAMVAAEAAVGAFGLDDVLDDAGLGEVNDEIDGGAADCMAQKGFSVARTTFAPGVEVDVYNLHADASGHPRDVEARADNFEQLADFILEHSAGRAVILGGDVNLRTGHRDTWRADADREVWERFQDVTGVTDVCAVLDCGDDAEVHDKFAFRSGGGVTITPRTHNFERDRFQDENGEPLSDHDALAVTFRWRTSGGR